MKTGKSDNHYSELGKEDLDGLNSWFDEIHDSAPIQPLPWWDVFVIWAWDIVLTPNPRTPTRPTPFKRTVAWGLFLGTVVTTATLIAEIV